MYYVLLDRLKWNLYIKREGIKQEFYVVLSGDELIIKLYKDYFDTFRPATGEEINHIKDFYTKFNLKKEQIGDLNEL